MKTKRILMAIIMLLSISVLEAQEPKNNAAKSQYKMYLAAIEKLKSIDPIEKKAAYKNQITQAENALLNVKKYEPDFNTSLMEEEIKKHKALIGDLPKDEKKEDLAKLRTALDNMKVGEESSLSSGSTSNWGQVQFYIDLYTKKYSEEDLAPYKKELEEYKKDYAVKMNAKKNDKDEIKKFEINFKKVYLNTLYVFKTDDEEKIPVIEANVNTYKKDLEAFLTAENLLTASKKTDPKINYWYKYVVEQGESAKSNIKKIVENCKSSYFTQKSRAVSNYCELQSYQIKFNCYKKLFGETPELVSLVNEITSLVNSAGTKQQLIDLAEKNKTQATKNRTMKPAVRTDAVIEEEIRNALKDKEGEIVKINLLDKEWRVVRNELTGIAIRRAQDFHLVMKLKDGSCKLYDLILFEDFDGVKYLSGYVSGFGTGWDILCENVK